MQILDYNLVLTCPCYPEQYDVLDAEGKQSGYIRLRGGNFRVYYPNTGVVRAGATISVKTEQDCKGQSLQQVTIK